jgi:hypothetical protein
MHGLTKQERWLQGLERAGRELSPVCWERLRVHGGTFTRGVKLGACFYFARVLRIGGLEDWVLRIGGFCEERKEGLQG